MNSQKIVENIQNTGLAKQRGAALVISLVILLVLTMLGVQGM